jgi:hypothetical protein
MTPKLPRPVLCKQVWCNQQLDVTALKRSSNRHCFLKQLTSSFASSQSWRMEGHLDVLCTILQKPRRTVELTLSDSKLLTSYSCW